MSHLLLRWALNAVALWITTELYGGLNFDPGGLGPILIAALVLGLVNAIVRPVMILLTLPLTVLTLGLFLLIVNALALAIVAAVTPLAITSFGAAILGALILSVISAALSMIIRNGRR